MRRHSRGKTIDSKDYKSMKIIYAETFISIHDMWKIYDIVFLDKKQSIS